MRHKASRPVCDIVAIPREPRLPSPRYPHSNRDGGFPMKGALAWLIGIPIPVIILLYVFDVF